MGYASWAINTNNNLRENIRIFCASLDSDSEFLWENYADANEGVMVTFEVLYNSHLSRAVDYVASKAEVIFKCFIDSGTEEERINSILFTKECSWDHEQEFRIVTHEKFHDTSIVSDVIPIELKFGRKISQGNRARLGEACSLVNIVAS